MEGERPRPRGFRGFGERKQHAEAGPTESFPNPGPESPRPPLRLSQDCFYAKHSTPSCAAEHASLDGPGALRCLLERTTQRTAALFAAWAAVGFAHGVLNTDNLSLLGVTIDMNVYGFLARRPDEPSDPYDGLDGLDYNDKTAK